MNLGFKELWIEDVFVMGFDKPVELHWSLPRMNLGFCEPVKLTKGGPWVWWAFGELTRDVSDLDFGETHQGQTLGLKSLVCVAHVLCSCIHATHGATRTGDVVSCSCICVTRGVAGTVHVVTCSYIRFTRGPTRTGDVVSCSCIRVAHWVAHTGDMVACSCICVTRGVARTIDMVSCSYIRVTGRVTHTGDVVCLENWPGNCPS